MKNQQNEINSKRAGSMYTFLSVLIVCILLIPIMGWSQNSYDDEINLALRKSDQFEEEVSKKLNLYSNHLKSSQISSLRLDSVTEFMNNVIEQSYKKWYYKYNDNQRLLSSETHYYSGDHTFTNTIEYRTYNEDEQLTKVIKQKKLIADNSKDTTIILYSEENNYQDGKLLGQHIYLVTGYNFYAPTGFLSITPYDSISYSNHYEYNQKGQLLRALEFELYTTWIASGRMADNHYYYNTVGLLKYKLQNASRICRYDYETNGNSLIKLEKNNYYPEIENNVEVFDTIMNWSYTVYDEITLDTKGRVVALINSTQTSYAVVRWYNFKAEFEYNQADQLVHASYYPYTDREDNTSYDKPIRIDNTYDDEGNLLEYHKIFYDTRTETWLTHEQKIYYYSSAKSAETFDDNEPTAIRVFPNPTQNVLNISIKDGTYSIFNITGKAEVTNKVFTKNIDVSNLKTGVYLIRLNDGKNVEILKFVKE